MLSVISWVLIIYLFISFVLFIRFSSLGMLKMRAVKRAFKFQFEIFVIHYSLFKRRKKGELREGLRLLFFPVVNLPIAIVGYADMYIEMDAFEYAIKELINDLSEQDREQLINHLVDSGRISIKENSKGNPNDDIDVVKRYKGGFDDSCDHILV